MTYSKVGIIEQIQEDITAIKSMLTQIIENMEGKTIPSMHVIKVSIPEAARMASINAKTMKIWTDKGKVNSVWNEKKTRKMVVIDEVFEKFIR